MKNNPLLSEILRGQWFIDIHNLGAYDQFLSKLLKGEAVTFDPKAKEEQLLGILDRSGKILSTGDGGALRVEPNSIAQVNVQGEIIKYGDYCIYGAVDIVAALDQCEQNPNIDATVMRFEGPGGSVSAIDVFYEFRARKTKPIVGLVSQALSLHCWIAILLCDYIIIDGHVSPMMGSIGVKCNYLDRKKQLEMVGIEEVEITADESEHKNLPFTLAKKGDYSLIKTEMLSPLAIKFQEAAKELRPGLLHEEVGVITGKTFYAADSVRVGLADEIGTIHTAMAKARALALKSVLKSK